MSDELDDRRARKYVWKTVKPGEPVELPEDPSGDDDPAEEQASFADAEEAEANAERAGGDLDELRREAFAACEILAAGVDRAFAIPEAAQQAQAVTALLGRASEMGASLAAMQHHPMQSARLLRLATRHFARLPQSAREHAQGSSIWLDYTHSECAEVIIEAARTGNRTIADSLYMAIGGARKMCFPRPPDFSRRLAEIVDQGPTWMSRIIALIWLEIGGGREAAPALRRALRLPHLSVRWNALSALRHRCPEALTAEDVLFLLDDAVIHPPPHNSPDEEVSRAACYYPEELARAVARVRPLGGEAPLRRMVEGSCVHVDHERGGLDPGWALSVLAASYPALALPLVDRWLGCVDGERRLWAVQAAARLPDEEAWPRLLSAAADGAPYIAECARHHWLARRGQPCPVDDLAGLPAGLCEGAPNDRLCSRLLVLRGRSREAQEAMVEVLLGEAPDPEALALLIFALADDGIRGYRRPGLPKDRKEWGKVLIDRFGMPAVQGLCALAARYPVGRYGWLSAMEDLVENGVITGPALPLVQAAAVHRLAVGSGHGEFNALALLRKTLGPCGAPPEAFERVWRTAMDMAAPDYVRSTAASVLAAWPEDARLDSDVPVEMEAALSARDLPRFSRLAAIALPRKIPRALSIAERALREHASEAPEEVAVEALRVCAAGLRGADRLSEAWLLSALAQPGSAGFTVAARSSWRTATPAVRRALRRALSKTAEDSAAAAESAIALLHLQEISVRHPRLAALCARAPLEARSKLIADLLFLRAPLSHLWAPLAELLTSADPEVTKTLRDRVCFLHRRRCRAQALEILPRIVDEDIRASIARQLRIPIRSQTYWQDTADPEP
jgi:hypothetical protein